MSFGKFWHRVFGVDVFFHLDILASGLTLLGTIDVDGDGLLDGKFDGTLGNKAKIGTGETMGTAGDVVDIDVVCDWRFP